MEDFLKGWMFLAGGLLASIGLYNSWAMRHGLRTFMSFPDSICPQAEWFFWAFLLLPLMLLSYFYW